MYTTPSQDTEPSALNTNTSANSSNQTMIDQSPITNSINIDYSTSEASLSQQVEVEQPQYFDPASENQEAVLNDLDHYPQLQQLRLSSPTASSLAFKKRPGSEELDLLHPSKRRGVCQTEDKTPTRGKSKMTRTRKPSRMSSLQATAPIIPDQLDNMSVPSLQASTSIHDSKKEHEVSNLNSQQQSSPSSQTASDGDGVFQTDPPQKIGIHNLEEKISHLESTIDTLMSLIKDKMFQHSEQERKNAARFERQSNLLDSANKEIGLLKSKVEVLESSVMDLEHEMTSAHLTLRVHARIIRRISGLRYDDFEVEYDQDSSDSPDSFIS
ncbi:uncharacterized protein MELLADRAFT_94949 [Melampsora larici-populina 98AG31]|uniref:Uncharacterized protein n=1 Tax=Melampsora larici-populina (strain 98AG31 / pathotype 3-4-7) TaxID=747676 RepID=F4RBM3_MELLP|nr:uncharacterized protein MELLADRAFT_94495 [Melampsora larici-populina 98AG31]XP_007417699.1 uncharacterized protein MELLADRAFT_94949 [Melampsora larici-populina 98AG31]EGF99013.1 hypothetical protein MELLADRAFT_94949 [Melampsora larici-populina 98AG31]EGG10125.1 hypothetical protein MELLADRAFT_94495 [Melampsora larici-populina 98AG31]